MVQLCTGSHQGKKNELALNCKLLEDRSNSGQSTGRCTQIPTAHTFILPLYCIIFNAINGTIFRDMMSLTTMLFRDVASPPRCSGTWHHLPPCCSGMWCHHHVVQGHGNTYHIVQGRGVTTMLFRDMASPTTMLFKDVASPTTMLFRDMASLTTMLFRDLDVPSPTPSCCVG